MNAVNALEIIRPLSEGVDPATGEVLPDGHVVQRPNVVRALREMLVILEAELDRQRRRDRLPGRAGTPWADSEDEQLTAAFDGGASLSELAKAHERTRSAIQARLVKLGKLSDIAPR